MKTVVLLCGVANSGKTKTLKAFFDVSNIKRLRPLQLLERNLNGKKVYNIGSTSPQEDANDFCNVEKIINRIRKRLKECEQVSQGQDYVLIIPFTMERKDGKVNDRCIVKPIEWLKSEGFNVFSLYLRKEKTDLLHLKDTLMKRISATTIESKKDEYDRQAKELESFTRKLELGKKSESDTKS